MQHNRRVVSAAASRAQQLGIRVGMPVSQAQAMCPEIAMRPADIDGDRAALDRLAAWCLRYAPIAAADPPDGLLIDISGAAHLRGGEAALVAELDGRLRRAGIGARIALAGTRGAAWGIARFGAHGTIVAEFELEAALASLPVAALRIGDETLSLLHRLGLERVGDLTALPRPVATRRVGETPFWRLDQALGHAADPIVPVTVPGIPRACLRFAEPIGHVASLGLAVQKLADQLCRRLERHGQGARRLDLVCTRADGEVQAVRIGTAQATRDARHIAALFQERLETIDAGVGGIESVSLVASQTNDLTATQDRLDKTAPGFAELGPLVDRIANRIGRKRIYRMTPVESDIPERSQKAIPPLAGARDATWPAGLERPERIFDPPHPIDAMALLPDHPPLRFFWRGRAYRVACADGPERIYGEWWHDADAVSAVRDYFRVEDEDGVRYWLFRAGDGVDPATGDMRWYLQGVFG